MYRPTTLIPPELYEHCIIYFEEGLYGQALNLLTTLLVSGCRRFSKPHRDETADVSYSLVPPSALIGLLATLVIHPSVTSHTRSLEKVAASNQALHFLYNLNRTAGPVNAAFSNAFIFVQKRRAASGRNFATSLHNRSDFPQGYQEVSFDLPNTKIAQHESLWACAEDFWHIVGWSFNCAAAHRERWERWRLLLELLLEIIEDDWSEREKLCKERKQAGISDYENIVSESLIVHFLTGCGGDTSGAPRRRVLRAVFACASANDLAEFREIFKGETKPKSKSEVTFKAVQDMNIEAGEFGDYYDEESEPEDQDLSRAGKSETLQSSSTRARNFDSPKVRSAHHTPSPDRRTAQFDGVDKFGDFDAMLLRRRLLILLSKVSLDLPLAFTNISAFVDVLDEFMRPLPLTLYSFLLSPTVCASIGSKGATWPPSALSSLLQELARELVGRSVPRNRDNYLTQIVLEEYYLPYAAKSYMATDNAKLSLLVENMIRLLRLHSNIDAGNNGFGMAVNKGINERRKRVQTRSRNGHDEVGIEAIDWLETSAIRLHTLVQNIEAQ